MFRGVVLLLGVALFAGAALCQETTAGKPVKEAAKPAATSRKPADTSHQHAAMSAAQAEALRADLQKMRSLLQQMENNLGSLESGPTPLKHQFELEIDMWRSLLDHMQRMTSKPAP